MRFFLYSYHNDANFEISKDKGIFGCKDSNDGLPTKFNSLQKGDIVIIRNSSYKALPKFYGYGVVTGKPYRDSNIVWNDEKKENKSIYPYKISVDFNNLPFALENINTLTWNNFISLSIKNKKGIIMNSTTSLGKFLSGNFIEEEYIENFKLVIGYKEHNSSINEQIKSTSANQDVTLSKEEKLKVFLESKNVDNEDDLELSRTIREQSIINRDRKTVKKLKSHYNNICQLCGNQIILQDGRQYSEVHHLHPLGEDGYDVAQNMMVVCPNCHVELDFGKVISSDIITFKEPHFIEDRFLDYQNNKHKI